MAPEQLGIHVPREQPHMHRDEQGIFVKCYHKCKTTLNFSFWLGVTISFPLEHILWGKIVPHAFPFMQPIIEWLMHHG